MSIESKPDKVSASSINSDFLPDMNPYIGLKKTQKSRFLKSKNWLDKLADYFN